MLSRSQALKPCRVPAHRELYRSPCCLHVILLFQRRQNERYVVPYIDAPADDISGIVSLLFCGITLKHYAYHTMSRRTQRTTKYMFAVLAQLSENFIFIYLGLNLFTQEVQVFKPLFILVSAVRGL